MKRFLLKHLSLIVILSIAVVSLTIAGVTFITSRVSYENYLKEYDKNAEEIKAGFPALPESVFIDNDYITYNDNKDAVAQSKSEYQGFKIMKAREATVEPLDTSRAEQYETLSGDTSNLNEYMTGLDRRGGAITFTIETETYGMSDIEIAMRTNYTDGTSYYAMPKLTDFIKIQVNKLELTLDEVTLPNTRDPFQSLIFKNTFLMKGVNTITFTTSAYNDFANKETYLYIMPDIRNVTIISDVTFASQAA